MASMIETALKSRDMGLSVVPIEPGTKKAMVKWTDYQKLPMGSDDIKRHFAGDCWFAIIAGEVSGNLELIDFDIPEKHDFEPGQTGTAPKFKPFCDFLIDHGHEELLNRLIWMQTKSGGMGMFYRCPDGVQGNLKLAERLATPEELIKKPLEKRKILIETRGNGGYFLTYPTPGYKILKGKFSHIPTITGEERELLHAAARFMSECDPETYAPERSNPSIQRPGDDFNLKAIWDEIITKHGWQKEKKHGQRTGWTRPGKSVRDGIGATSGNGPNDLLYMFTSSAHPFEPSRSYSKFAAYALLECRGDFFAAANQLKGLGYGRTAPRAEPLPNGQVRRPGPDNEFDMGGEDDTFESMSLHDAAPEKPDWLWEPYLMRRHLNLLDAKGSSGKTTLIVATALMLSQGRIPFGGECEPVTTLYFGCEDTPGEVRFLADKIGGDFTKFIHISDPLIRLDTQGLAKVYRTIKKHKAALVVFDAITYYFAGLVRDPYNGMEIAPHLNKLRDVARESNSTIWNVRHFSKYSKGKDIEEMGAGAEQWRNSHRRQLVLRPHPEVPRYGIVCPARGSLNAGKGEAFAFSMQNDIFGWIPNPDLSVFDADKEQAVPPLKKLEAAKAFIRSLCGGQFVLSAQVWEQAKASFISDGTLKRASNEMKEAGELQFKRWDKEGPWSWHVPIVEVDPYADPE